MYIRLTGKGIPIINPRRSDDCLRVMMRILIPIRPRLLREERPGSNDNIVIALRLPIFPNAQNAVTCPMRIEIKIIQLENLNIIMPIMFTIGSF